MVPDSIPVVCAIIERNGLVLLAQRPPHKHLGGKWEFPGGKVETDETPRDAIIREISEELGSEFTPRSALPRSVHHYEKIAIEMIPFVGCLTETSASPQYHEHVALSWAKPSELLNYDLAPADIPVVTAYREALESND